MQLSYETWDDVFSSNDVDTIFNSFLNTYLRIVHSRFPIRKYCSKLKTNNWITPGIRISCRRKRELYLLYRNNDIKFKTYYKSYCKILSTVINTAKRLYYDGLITNSKNKIKTTWNIVKSITGKNLENKLPLSVCINGALTENQQVIADSFQSHFLFIDDKLVSNNIEDINDINYKDYLYRIFKNPYPNIIFDRTTKEIENIIKWLKTHVDMTKFWLKFSK
jgi:hypothetical protein